MCALQQVCTFRPPHYNKHKKTEGYIYISLVNLSGFEIRIINLNEGNISIVLWRRAVRVPTLGTKQLYGHVVIHSVLDGDCEFIHHN